jgi:hypothetical protein
MLPQWYWRLQMTITGITTTTVDMIAANMSFPTVKLTYILYFEEKRKGRKRKAHL